MTFTSPLPSVSLPASPLTPYTLERRTTGRQDRLHRGGHRPDDDLRRARGRYAVRRAVGWSAWPKGEVVAVMAPNCPEYGVLFPRRRAGGWCAHHGQPDLHVGRSTPPTRRLGRHAPRDDPDVLETATAAIADSAVSEVYVIGEADGYTSICRFAANRLAEQVPVRSRRRRRVAVLLGDDRPGEGRHAHAPQPRLEHLPDTRHAHDGSGRCVRRAAVLPHLRHAGAHEHGAAGRSHDRHDAALRSRAVPVAAWRASPHVRARRAAHGRRAGEASGRRQLRPPPFGGSSPARRRHRPTSPSSAVGDSAARWYRATA